MEWTQSLKRAIDYMEEHLLEDIHAGDVADTVFMSPYYFQKGFKIMTGYTVGEYIRGRRLYLAALDVARGKEKIIDIALRYGYDTPESFTKAFSRFHRVSPIQMQGDIQKIKVFLPLTISISIQGGTNMDYAVEKMDKMTVIGFDKRFSFESSYQDIPKFWDEYCEKYCQNRAKEDVQKAVEECNIGEFGVCIDDEKDETGFHYMIAGRYDGRDVPRGMTVYEIPALTWAKFRCVGPMPGALQSVNTKIFKEWLPGNPTYEIAKPINIEWYSMGDLQSTDYESGIWIPVKEK